jgi:hypothetical protein
VLVYGATAAILVGTGKSAIVNETTPSLGQTLGVVWGTVFWVAIPTTLSALRPRTVRVRVIMIGLLVPVLVSAVVGTVRAKQYDSEGLFEKVRHQQATQLAADNSLAKRAGVACGETRVPEAIARSSDTDIVPLIIVDQNGSLFGRDTTKQRGWLATNVHQLKTVVCLGQETKGTETCSYSGNESYRLTSYRRDVKIIAAYDGTRLAVSTLFGGSSNCYKTIVAGHAHDMTSDHVSTSSVIDYVSRNIKTLGSD